MDKRLILLFSVLLLISISFAWTVDIFLVDPANETWTNIPEFTFYFWGETEFRANCELFINETPYGTELGVWNDSYATILPNDTLDQEYHEWHIECTNDTTETSDTWYFGYDETNGETIFNYPLDSIYITGNITVNITADGTYGPWDELFFNITSWCYGEPWCEEGEIENSTNVEDINSTASYVSFWWDTTNSTEENFLLEAWVFDEAGNDAPVAQINVLVDNSPPKTYCKDPCSYTNEVSPNISFIIREYISEIENSSFVVTINGTDYPFGHSKIYWNEYGPDYAEVTFENDVYNWSEGEEVNVSVNVSDILGNYYDPPRDFSFIIDLVPPEVNMFLSINESIGPNNPTTIYANATDDKSLYEGYLISVLDDDLLPGKQYIYYNINQSWDDPIIIQKTWNAKGYKLDNGTIQSETLITVLHASEGPEFYIVFGWFAGNSTLWEYIPTFAIFNSSLNLVEIEAPGEIFSGDIFIELNFENEEIGFPFSEPNIAGGINGTIFTINPATFKLVQANVNDSHNFTIQSVFFDEARNDNTTEISVTTDVTPPDISTSLVPSTIEKGQSSEFSCTSSDSGSGLENITILLDDVMKKYCDTDPSSCSYSQAFPSAGSFTFICESKDSSQNVAIEGFVLSVTENDGNGGGNNNNNNNDNDDDDDDSDLSLGDVLPPSITLLLPADNTNLTNNKPIFGFKASDDQDMILKCLLKVNDSVRDTDAGVDVDRNTNLEIGIALEDGYYEWVVECEDDAGRVGASSTRAFTILTGAVVVISENETIGETNETTSTFAFPLTASAISSFFKTNPTWLIALGLVILLVMWLYFRFKSYRPY